MREGGSWCCLTHQLCQNLSYEPKEWLLEEKEEEEKDKGAPFDGLGLWCRCGYCPSQSRAHKLTITLNQFSVLSIQCPVCLCGMCALLHLEEDHLQKLSECCKRVEELKAGSALLASHPALLASPPALLAYTLLREGLANYMIPCALCQQQLTSGAHQQCQCSAVCAHTGTQVLRYVCFSDSVVLCAGVMEGNPLSQTYSPTV